MPAMSHRLERLRFGLECLSYVAVIAGIFLFFVQQGDSKRVRRIETAMLFVSLANEDRYARARAEVVRPWRDFDMAQLKSLASSRATRDRLKLAVTKDLDESSIETLVEFYTSIVSCRNDRLCDGAIIDRFFKRDISFFYCLYDVQLRQIARRLDRPEYGSELMRYGGSCS
jgi:hypothetical protein